MHTSTKIGVFALVFAAVAFAAYRCPCLNGKLTDMVGRSAQNIKWTDCDGTGSNYFSVSDIQIKGTFDINTKVDFTILGTVKQAYTHAFTDTTIKLGFIQVFQGVASVDPPEVKTPGPLSSTSTT